MTRESLNDFYSRVMPPPPSAPSETPDRQGDTEYEATQFGIGQWVILPLRQGSDPYGTPVEAVVTGILITAGEHNYNCAWCLDGTQQKDWFEGWRLVPAKD